jgi:uncharacterized protein (UPF0297 family)
MTGGDTKKLNFINPENIQYNLINQVAGALRNENECVSTKYSAARTSWVMEEIVKSYYR